MTHKNCTNAFPTHLISKLHLFPSPHPHHIYSRSILIRLLIIRMFIF
eukprot:UN10765